MDEFTSKCASFFKRDRFASEAGIRILEAAKGFAKVELKVEDRHLNGADILHGGALFTLADFAFAVASNSHGRVALSVSSSISFMKSVMAGDTVTATARELSLGYKMATYAVEIADGKGALVASMQGTVYRKDDVIRQLADA